MSGKHAPESSASFILSLSRATGGAVAALAVMAILVFALLNRGSAEPEGAGPAITSPTASPTRTATTSPQPSTVSPTPKPSVLAPSKVTVQVLNGTARSGLAAATAQEIDKAGYKLAGTGNAPRTEKSTIFYRKGRRAEALALQQLFPDFTVLKEATSSQAAILRVVLGADWPETG
jgi:LytR cell envelope-related transcriptional attenuator